MSLSESDGEIELLIFEDQNQQNENDGFNLPDMPDMPLDDPFITTEPPPLDIDYEVNAETKDEPKIDEKPNEIIPQGEFSIGIAYPTSCSYRTIKRRSYGSASSVPSAKRVKYNAKPKQSKKQGNEKKTIPSPETEQEPPKDPKIVMEEMIALFDDTNPYYTTTRATHKVYNSIKAKIEFTNKPPFTQAGHIKIIIPRSNQTLRNFFAYNSICYKTGNFFDWQVILGELDISGPLFKFPKSKPQIKIKGHKPLLNEDIYKEAEKIFCDNQWFRWQMKRLVSFWLKAKSQKRVIGEDCDIITGDQIPKEEQVRIISIKNRTEYVFSGQVLVKGAKSCLEGQTAAIPHVKTPHNPYTNTPFTYGELVKVYNEILIWCAKKGKAIPATISLYREYKFKNNMLLRVNHNYIQMKATDNYIFNDDTRGEFFIEAMEILLEDFGLLLEVEFDPLLIGYQRFRLWNQLEPKHHLMLAWKKLAADFWYYKQTEQFPRENWRSESSIYIDLSILMKASRAKLQYVGKEYQRRRLQQQQQQQQANPPPV